MTQLEKNVCAKDVPIQMAKAKLDAFKSSTKGAVKWVETDQVGNSETLGMPEASLGSHSTLKGNLKWRLNDATSRPALREKLLTNE